MTRKRVLIVQPSLQPPGGGNGLAAWAVQALQDDHDLTLLTIAPLDLGEVNTFYGTSIRADRLSLLDAGWWPRRLGLAPVSLALLKNALLMRRIKSLTEPWDVAISLNNEVDFGCRGIQYVHYPAFTRPRPKADVRWYHGPPLVLDAYYAFCDWIGNVSPDRIRGNLTLVNSDWTGSVFKAQHGVDAITVYPPVHTNFHPIPWEERINGFLCIGRIAPEKELHRVIDIVAGVRKRQPDVTLRIVGTFDDNAYCRSVRDRVSESSWISINDSPSRVELLQLIPQYRYGIHGMTEEHFGMAPAEMAAGGCLVWVHNAGGQVEVVAKEPGLIYTSTADAIDKICALMDTPKEQLRLRDALAARVRTFSTKSFMQAMRDVVAAFPASVGR